MAAEEITTFEQSHQEQLAIAGEKLQRNGIVRLAVAGTSESDDYVLAREVGFGNVPGGVDFYDSYDEVVAACSEKGVAGLLPVVSPTGEKLPKNMDLWTKAARASIASLVNPRNGTVNKLLIAN